MVHLYPFQGAKHGFFPIFSKMREQSDLDTNKLMKKNQTSNTLWYVTVQDVKKTLRTLDEIKIDRGKVHAWENHIFDLPYGTGG